MYYIFSIRDTPFVFRHDNATLYINPTAFAALLIQYQSLHPRRFYLLLKENRYVGILDFYADHVSFDSGHNDRLWGIFH